MKLRWVTEGKNRHLVVEASNRRVGDVLKPKFGPGCYGFIYSPPFFHDDSADELLRQSAQSLFESPFVLDWAKFTRVLEARAWVEENVRRRSIGLFHEDDVEISNSAETA